MAMDQPLDTIPRKMTDGETLVNGEEGVSYTFASFFRRKVEDIVETCKIEIVINNREHVKLKLSSTTENMLSLMGTTTSSPKRLSRHNRKPEGEKTVLVLKM